MKKTKVFLAIATALTLSACGGGGDDSTPAPAPADDPVTTKEYKAIDGYLVNADIYVDRNKNKIADEDEKLEQVTGTNGEFSVEEKDTKYPIIIKAIAGVTSDSDKEGKIDKDFTFVADSGIDIISPFSTMAYKTDKTLEELQTELDLPSGYINADYVAKKLVDESKSEAGKVHALARALTERIANGFESSKLIESAKNIKKSIDEDVNNGKDLDESVYDISLKERLISEVFTVIHTYKSQFGEEGVFANVTFNETEVSSENNGEKETNSIEYYENSFKIDNDPLDYVVHVSPDWMLIKTTQKELSLFIEKDKTEKLNEYVKLTESDFAGKTFYHFWDDSTSDTPDPDFATFKFSQDVNKVTILENGAESDPLDWKITSDGDLAISGINDDGTEFIISKTAASELDTNFIIFNHGRSINDTIKRPYIITENKELADTIFKEWNSKTEVIK
ncbi:MULTISPECIES: hypothetical protein [unclassified Photobacterium]|uniref:hypothetical protein n=1 Tax=unclassified Photobacterium TaxID=2628852 RepID=UPI001EDE0DD6|nr:MULTISPECIES: hypothetical protein [unclassified Photobacterium]MCG3863470.1 hypothetical protein [Photobacterium sp. Ph6]MCG3874999.1 hypothetical protein [Photobacterium sp. Ph5]